MLLFQMPSLRPSSPPPTPTTSTFIRAEKGAMPHGRTSSPAPPEKLHHPVADRHNSSLELGLYPPCQTPPIDSKINPQAPQFCTARLAPPQGLSSRSSTPSSVDSEGNGSSKVSELAEDGDLLVEEVTGSDLGDDNEIEIVQPDHYEEPTTAWNACTTSKDSNPSRDDTLERETNLVSGLQGMCSDEFADGNQEGRRRWRRTQRWSGGIIKRSHSQSIGTDNEDDTDGAALEGNGIPQSPRRLRRRVREAEDGTLGPVEDVMDTS
ncbi:MAG: hypothetical protein M1833_002354 [Piccolia ochrophora]|nr:MAG: hypothetical protein M1833_002354 [Piccolia ochrophora]